MPYLKLKNEGLKVSGEYRSSEVVIGRAATATVVVAGSGADVVSSAHAKLSWVQDRWMLEDLGSTNGTFFSERRLVQGERQELKVGDSFRLGAGGPQFTVEAVRQDAKPAPTVKEALGIGPDDKTVPMDAVEIPRDLEKPGELLGPQATVVLEDPVAKKEITLNGTQFRLGRGKECDVKPSGTEGTSVSRVHAEIALKPDGNVVLRDMGSRNGTFVNRQQLTRPYRLSPGDVIELGPDGPSFTVVRVEGPPVASNRSETQKPKTAPAKEHPSDSKPKTSSKPNPPRRSFGGLGRTVFVKQLMDENAKTSSRRIRKVVWTFTFMLVGAVAAAYWYSEEKVRQTQVVLAETAEQLDQQRLMLAEQRAVADSLQAAAVADYERLRMDFDSARSGSAPSAVLDSLREQLAAAERRTEALEVSMQRAQADLNAQLAQADSVRRIREAEVSRLRTQIAAANSNSASTALLDSLRQAVSDAERQLGTIEGQVRAVRGVDLASVAQMNQGAVGLVSSYIGRDVFDGSGFVITRSGFFLTNRHVVEQDGRRADSVFVTMADQRTMVRADIVTVSDQRGPDIALLRLRNYQGPHIPRLDWSGTRARQGEPAALIGFPKGLAVALDRGTRTVRTSMSGGIFSQVTQDEIRFDGFTVGGSSGSPIMNAAGEVVAIHRAGLQDGAGLAFAVPVRLAVPLFPAALRGELNLR